MTRRPPRTVVTLAVAAALAPLALGSVASPADAARPESSAAPTTISWSRLDVPYLANGKLKFRGGVAALDGLADDLVSIAATEHSAVIAVTRPHKTRSQLLELRAGEKRLLPIASRVIGIPLADPSGDLVFWTAKLTTGGFQLQALDTDTHLIARGPKVSGDTVPYAVDGNAVYAVADGADYRWAPFESPSLDPLPEEIRDAGVLTDAASLERVVAGPETTRLLDDKGNELGAVTQTGYATLDPTNRFAAYVDDGRLAIQDVAQDVQLELAGYGIKQAVAARWTPHGYLVIAWVPVGRDATRASQKIGFVVCNPTSEHCADLPRGGVVGTTLPDFESTARGQAQAVGRIS